MRTERRMLSELVRPKGLIGGPFGSSLGSDDYVADGVPVIRGTNLGWGKYVEGPFAYVSPEKVRTELARNLAAPGDIIFTQRGTLGQVAIVPSGQHDSYVVSQSQMRLRVDPDLAVNDFIYYATSSAEFAKQVHDNAISTGVPHINLGILSRLTIPLPALDLQRAISEVLSALDDKIALNRAMAATIEARTGAQYQSLNSADSRIVKVGDILALEYGKSLPASFRRAGRVPVYGSGGVTGSHDQALVDRAGVVVGRKGTAGAVHWASGPHFPIDTTYFVVPKAESVSSLFCYFALKSLNLHQQNSDSAVPGLNRNEALATKLRLPSSEVLKRFDCEAIPAMRLASQLDAEIESLVAMREALLPQLMNGALHVRDFERTLLEVV